MRFTLTEREVDIQAAAYGTGGEAEADAARKRRGFPANYTLTDADGVETEAAATGYNEFTFNQNNWGDVPNVAQGEVTRVGVVVRRDGVGGVFLIMPDGAGGTTAFSARPDIRAAAGGGGGVVFRRLYQGGRRRRRIFRRCAERRPKRGGHSAGRPADCGRGRERN